MNDLSETPPTTRGPDDELVTPEYLLGLIGFNIRRAQLALRRSYFKSVADGNVRPGQASLIQLIGANPGASQVELAKALGVDKATIVSLIDRSEKAGWVVRKPGRQDRRRHELHLTGEGEKKRRQLQRQMHDHEAAFRDRFNERELKQLLEYLQRIFLDEPTKAGKARRFRR